MNRRALRPAMDGPLGPTLAAFVGVALVVGASAGVVATLLSDAPLVAPPSALPAAVAPLTFQGPLEDPTGSRIGRTSYDGPRDAASMFQACGAPSAPDASACYARNLAALLDAEGAEAAFTLLEDMAKADPQVDAHSHHMAHTLGRRALVMYGSIENALRNCSYKVFAGCFHGALETYFHELPSIEPEHILKLCPADDTLFRRYTCMHGIGHGLLLARNYDMNATLALCDDLDGDFAEQSCYGGVVMQNFVGYLDARQGSHHDDGHEDEGPEPVFLIDAKDLMFPCDVIGAKYQPSCWLMQTSVILHLTGADFRRAAQVCGDVPAASKPNCHRSLGRDASDYTHRDTAGGVERCAMSMTPEGRRECIRGFTADSILYFATPEAGLAHCKAMPEVDKEPCASEVGLQGGMMVDREAMAKVCAQLDAHQDACRRGAGLS